MARLEEFVVRVYDQVSRYPGLAARIAHQLPGTASSRRNQAFVAELLASSGLSSTELGNLTAVVFLYTWGHLVGGEASWQVGGFPASLAEPPATGSCGVSTTSSHRSVCSQRRAQVRLTTGKGTDRDGNQAELLLAPARTDTEAERSVLSVR